MALKGLKITFLDDAPLNFDKTKLLYGGLFKNVEVKPALLLKSLIRTVTIFFLFLNLVPTEYLTSALKILFLS